MVKCPICGESFDRNSEEYVQVKRRYAHKSCFEKLRDERTKEQKDLDALEDYIKTLFKIDFVDARIRQQINKMRRDYGYSYSGILKSLVYFFEVKGNSIEKANGGIGIVPYVYQKAYEYYYELHIAKEKNKGKDLSNLISNTRTVMIPSPKRRPRIKKLFSMEDE